MMKSFGNFLFVVIFNKITSQANIQPWPIRVERVGSCCDVIFKAEHGTSSATGLLDHCVVFNTDHDLHSDVAILNFGVPGNGPFSVPDIQDFAVYQRAIIASYAETNRYLFRSITPDSSNWHNCRMKINDTISREQSFGTTDYRWFKVKFLMDAMDTACGWAKDSKFLVWIDADAIVLDFGLRIEQIASSYPLADLIASADIRMGLINTGFLILRNTPWMRSFLHDWWYSVDKTIVCDQDAFDQLYARYSIREEKEQQHAPLHADSIQRKVKVLPMDALNSHPPAMLHQQDSNRVLHLMGEATSLRTAVFRKGFQNICAARSGGVLPAQLGLRRDVLIRYALAVYKEQVQALQLAANSSADSNDRSLNNIGPSQQHSNISSTSSRTYNESSLEEAFLGPVDALMRAAHHYCDLLHHMQRSSPTIGGDHQLEAQRLRHSILQLIVGRVDDIRRNLSMIDRETAVAVSQLHQTAEIPASPAASSSAEVLTLQSDLTIVSMRKAALVSVMLQLLKKAAEASNDLFGASDAVQDKLNAAQLVFDILEDIISLVDESSRVVPMHMKALMHQNLGLLHYDISMSFAEGDGGDDAPSHSLSNSSTTSSNSITALEFSKAHLHQSYDHLKSSVSLFDEYLQNSTESSTLMEASYSIQLWAGVACTMKRYRDGTKLWDRAISHAYHSLQGINQGVRYDNLAAVLYNAAQCYKDSNQLQRATELVRDALSVIESSINSSGGSPTQTTLRATIQSFSDKLQQPISSRDRRGEREGERERQREAASVNDPRIGSDELTVGSMRPVDTPSGRVYIPINKASSDGTSQAASSDSDDQLWEECSQEEQARGDCESFYVYEDEDDEGEGHESKGDDLVRALQVDERPPEALIDADDPLAGLDTDGMTDEDIAELAEVRLRHAEHTARLLTNSLGTHQTPSIADNPSIVDRLNAIERTLSQLLLEVKALKGLIDPSSHS